MADLCDSYCLTLEHGGCVAVVMTLGVGLFIVFMTVIVAGCGMECQSVRLLYGHLGC